MFDPLFGISLIGAPFALMYLMVEAQRNPRSEPSFGTCLLALFAGYGVFQWVVFIGMVLFDPEVNGGSVFALQFAAGVVAVLTVGVPFALNARARRRRGTQR